MKNPPSFQFYPQDFLSDLNVRDMSDAEVGMYIKLLCTCWIEDGLPSGTSRVVEGYFKKSPTVARCFVEKDGKYRNPRLDYERERQLRWREKCSKGGVHSAEKKKHIKGSARVVQLKANSSVFPLHSSSKENHKNDFLKVVSSWNSINVRNLKEGESKVREKTEAKVRAVLQDHPVEAVLKAIENYGEVIHHPDAFFFTYKWELADFLQRGLRKFMDDAKPFENFRAKKGEASDPRTGARDPSREAFLAAKKKYEDALIEKYRPEMEAARAAGDTTEQNRVGMKISAAMDAWAKEYKAGRVADGARP